jgi:hypothetical protein
MAKMRMSMRKVREVLRLTHELGLSVRQVCEATGVGKTAVSEYVSRAKVVGITWPIPPEIDDAALERLLFTPASFHEGSLADMERPRNSGQVECFVRPPIATCCLAHQGIAGLLR